MYESSFQVPALSQPIPIGSVKLLGTTTYYLLYIYGTPFSGSGSKLAGRCSSVKLFDGLAFFSCTFTEQVFKFRQRICRNDSWGSVKPRTQACPISCRFTEHPFRFRQRYLPEQSLRFRKITDAGINSVPLIDGLTSSSTISTEPIEKFRQVLLPEPETIVPSMEGKPSNSVGRFHSNPRSMLVSLCR